MSPPKSTVVFTNQPSMITAAGKSSLETAFDESSPRAVKCAIRCIPRGLQAFATLVEIPLKLIPVILSGGAGTRLWPASREAEPKPFIAIPPDNESLLQKVMKRAFSLSAIAEVPEVMIVTNRDHLFRTVDQRMHMQPRAGDAEYGPVRFVLEPSGRNTAPAIAIAAHAVAAIHGRDVVMLVLPADHLITKLDAYRDATAKA